MVYKSLTPHRFLPPSPPHTPQLCPVPRKSHGLINLTLLRSHTCCTSLRRPTSPECSSVRCSMVCRLAQAPIQTYLVSRSIVLGIVAVLFFQCMIVLLSSTYRRRRGARWGLVAFATTSFLFVTINTMIGNFYIQSDSYVDNRDFPGTDELPPGPLGYQYLTFTSPVAVVANFMFFLNNWLADGLLVSSEPDSTFGAPHVCQSCSSIVAIFSTTGNSGSLPSHASCTSLL